MYLFKRNISLLIILCVIKFGCSPPEKMKVLIQMIDAQEKYFREEVAMEFEEIDKAEIDVIHYSSIDSINAELKKNKGETGLVKVPFEKSRALIRQGAIKSLNSFLSKEEIKEFNQTYMLTSLAESDGYLYYIPRKFETRCMVYLKSKVKEALAVWRKQRQNIHEDLKKYNKYGLPVTYLLEDDPNEWDYFDIFVAGWIWSHTSYNGKVSPRIAHRGKYYSGTSHRIVDRVFQCNGDSASVVSMTGDAVLDVFLWEAVYAAAGIYNTKMWKENWSGTDIWKGFAENEVFLSFMTQLDCFFIHGTGQDGLTGYLENPDDMGLAVMPAGCSLELTESGDILRNGTKAITTGGWWWGIPSSATNPRKSYQFARHITSMENQVQACSRFGMIPVRKDVLSDMQMLFGGEWVSLIYNVAFKQLMYNKFTIVPSHPRFDEIGNLYLDTWVDIVVNKNWSSDHEIPDREYIKRRINEKYIPAINRIK